MLAHVRQKICDGGPVAGFFSEAAASLTRHGNLTRMGFVKAMSQRGGIEAMQRSVEDLFFEPETETEKDVTHHPRTIPETLWPWQRFLLATLLFLDVTVVGFLFLVILGRFQFR